MKAPKMQKKDSVGSPNKNSKGKELKGNDMVKSE
jgi:hypothetical protein